MQFSDNFNENLSMILEFKERLMKTIIVSEEDSANVECVLYYLNKAVLSGKHCVTDELVALQTFFEDSKGGNHYPSEMLETLKSKHYYDKKNDRYEYIVAQSKFSLKSKLYFAMISIAVLGICVLLYMLNVDASVVYAQAVVLLIGITLCIFGVVNAIVDTVQHWGTSKIGVPFVTKSDVIHHLFYVNAMRDIVMLSEDNKFSEEVYNITRILSAYVNDDSFKRSKVVTGGKYLVEVDRLRNKMIEDGML